MLQVKRAQSCLRSWSKGLNHFFNISQQQPRNFSINGNTNNGLLMTKARMISSRTHPKWPNVALLTIEVYPVTLDNMVTSVTMMRSNKSRNRIFLYDISLSYHLLSKIAYIQCLGTRWIFRDSQHPVHKHQIWHVHLPCQIFIRDVHVTIVPSTCTILHCTYLCIVFSSGTSQANHGVNYTATR